MIAFISSLAFWRAGWEVGPRYVTAMLPFALPAIVACVDACRLRGGGRLVGVVAAPMLVGIAIYVVAMATFPYWPDTFDHPLYDVSFRMLGDGLVSPSVATLLGVDGVPGIVPYLLLAAAIAGVAVWRAAGAHGLAIATVGAALWIAGYGALPHGGTGVDLLYARVVKLVLVRG
jgi:hypothetical protein